MERNDIKNNGDVPQVKPGDGVRELYGRYSREFAERAAALYGLDESQAAEVFHEAFLALYYNLSAGRLRGSQCSLRTAIFAICDHKAEHGRRNETPVSFTDVPALMKSDPLGGEGRARRQRLVEEVAEEVNEPYGTLLTLYYGRGLTLEETAVAMESDGPTVRRRKTLCVKKLREAIAAREGSSNIAKVDQDAVDRYLRGDMASDELTAFESEMAADPALRGEVETMAHISEAFTRRAESDALRELLALNSDRELLRAVGRGNRPSRRRAGRYGKRLGLLAAFAAFALMFYGYMPRYSSRTLYEEAFRIPTYTADGDGEMPEAEEELQWRLGFARELYSARDYSGAAEVYERMFKEYGQEQLPPQAAFYRAASYLALENFERAGEMFEEVMHSGSPYAPDARWYAALSHLARGERLTARELLEQIAGNGDNPHAGDAGQLVERISTKRWF